MYRTGYGQHGDYLFGWKDDSLQKAMDALPSGKCANANCSVLKVQSAAAAKACKKAQQVLSPFASLSSEPKGLDWIGSRLTLSRYPKMWGRMGRG